MANLIPRGPFTELVGMGSIFDRFFDRTLARLRPPLGLLGEGFRFPAMGVYDRESHIVVKVKHSYKDGILTIELPRSKAAISKETDIQTE
ncbi:hypothetical protein GTN66_05130 [bacterium]|nr:hypothetical protein [bacterium]NIN92725.1 hypothetical protein [bacterium]NIO18706.1 hypothetical protein [bacterium]NIO73782.1 hypothetical protein [bacterium]